MQYKIILVCILATLFGVSVARQVPYFWSPLNLYVSDQNSTKVLKNQQRTTAVLFTNKHCPQCHSHQSQLTNIISELHSQHQILTYRAEISLNPGLQQQFNIKRFPMLHFVFNQNNVSKLYFTTNIVTLESTIKTVNKIQYYLYNIKPQGNNQWIYVNQERFYLSSQQQITQLFGLNPLYHNLPYFIFQNNTDFAFSIQNLPLSQQPTCVIYIPSLQQCFDPQSIQQLQHLMGTLQYSQVTEFTQSTYQLYQQLLMPRTIFVAVLDSIFEREQSQLHIHMLNQILNMRQIKHKVTIFWMETQINRQKLTHLGFDSKANPPLFALFDLNNPVKTILKNQKGPVFSRDQILKFIRKIIQYDQEQGIAQWHSQLILQSLQRLQLNKYFQLIQKDDLNKMSIKNVFVLCLPYLDYHQLLNNKIFYKTIQHYHYVVQRIKRFSKQQIGKSLIVFESIQHQKKQKQGLFYLKKQKQLMKIADIEYNFDSIALCQQNQNHLRRLFQLPQLPQLFWLSEDLYQQYLVTHPKKLQEITYETVQLDI